MAASQRVSSPPPVHATPLVTVTIRRPAPSVFVTHVKGRLDLAGAIAVESALRLQVQEDKVHFGFHDWELMTNYDGAARAHLTNVARELLPALRACHFLVGAAVVRFGVLAANIVLRRLTVEPSRESFDRALSSAIAYSKPALSEIRRRPTWRAHDLTLHDITVHDLTLTAWARAFTAWGATERLTNERMAAYWRGGLVVGPGLDPWNAAAIQA